MIYKADSTCFHLGQAMQIVHIVQMNLHYTGYLSGAVYPFVKAMHLKIYASSGRKIISDLAAAWV